MSHVPKVSSAGGYVGGMNQEERIICQYAHMTNSMGCYWFGCRPLAFSLTLLMLQLILIFFVNRIFFFFLRPLQQSILSCQLIGGIVFAGFLRIDENLFTSLFPEFGKMVLETLANFGFMIHAFVVGVQIDTRVLKNVHKHAIVMGCMSFLVPYAVSILTILVLPNITNIDQPTLKNLPFIAAISSITTFPAITSTLSDLNILNTELGRLACSTGLVADICSFLISFAMTTLGFAVHTARWKPLNNIFWFILYLLTIWFVLRPFVLRIARRIPEGQQIKESQFLVVFVIVLMCGLGAECLGQMAAFGGFVMGICVPDGPPFGTALVNRLDWVSAEILVPAKFTISAINVNFHSVGGPNYFSSFIMEVLIIIGYIAKFTSNLILAMHFGVSPRDAFLVAVILCTRGIIDIAAFSIVRANGVITEQGYSLLVLNMILVTGIGRFIVWHFYDSSRRYKSFRRNIAEASDDDFLRMVVCIHIEDNVPTIINLLEASNPTRARPIAVFTMNLLELTGRSSSILVPTFRADKIPGCESRVTQIMKAFDLFVQRHQEFIMVQHFTAMAPYSSMHEDICTISLDKGANIIIVPFHKRWTIDGTVGATFPGIRSVNLKVMDKAPCSVGILVDRGQIGGPQSILTAKKEVFRITQLFLGGPDDREALAYSSRMAQHPYISLLLVFLRPEDVGIDPRGETYETRLDNEMIRRFRDESIGRQSIIVREEVAKDAVETVELLRSMEHGCDLFIVGREHGFATSQLTYGLSEWSECPELGGLGDLLASSEFKFSVLVVQQQQPGDNFFEFTDEFSDALDRKVHSTHS